MSPICTLVWHNLRFSWMQPLFKHRETRKKDGKGAKKKEQTNFSRNEKKATDSVILRCICRVMWNLKWVKFLMYCTIVMLTCYWISHCSGWLETVTVGSSAHGRRGSRCAAQTDGTMRPAVNCRGRGAKIRHSHLHTVAGVEVRKELHLQIHETFCKYVRVYSQKLRSKIHLPFKARNCDMFAHSYSYFHTVVSAAGDDVNAPARVL